MCAVAHCGNDNSGASVVKCSWWVNSATDHGVAEPVLGVSEATPRPPSPAVLNLTEASALGCTSEAVSVSYVRGLFHELSLESPACSSVRLFLSGSDMGPLSGTHRECSWRAARLLTLFAVTQ